MKYLELEIVNEKLFLRVEVIWVSVSLCWVRVKNNRHLMKEDVVMIGSVEELLWWGTETGNMKYLELQIVNVKLLLRVEVI